MQPTAAANCESFTSSPAASPSRSQRLSRSSWRSPGGTLLTLWVGAEYAAGAPLVLVLAAASLISASQWPAAEVLQGIARHRVVAWTAIVAGLSNVALSAALLPIIGLMGVALGTLIPTVVGSLCVVLPFANRTLNVPWKTALTDIWIPGLAPGIPAAVVLMALHQYAEPATLPMMAAWASITGGVYALAYLSMPAAIAERRLAIDVVLSSSRTGSSSVERPRESPLTERTQMSSILHSPVVLKTVQALHLSTVARDLAFRAATRGRSRVSCTRAGTTATFCVPNPAVWRAIDTIAVEPILSEWLSHVRSDDVVYDVGAHYGVYSMFAAAKGARVFAFDPDAERHEVFLANRSANNVDALVTLAPVALSDHDGHTSLYAGTGVAALADVATDLHRRTTHFDVPLVRADHYAATNGAPPPTVLKIDVEGYESAVFDGLGDLLRGVRIVLCEIHPDSLLPGESLETIYARLERAGLVPVESARLDRRHHVLASRCVIV